MTFNKPRDVYEVVDDLCDENERLEGEVEALRAELADERHAVRQLQAQLEQATLVPPWLYTITTLAERLSVSKEKLYRMRTKGNDLPPSLNIHGSTRWRPQDVEAWIEKKLKENS